MPKFVAKSSEATGLAWEAAPTPSYTWTTWTPTTAGITLGNGTLISKYQQISKIVNFYLRFALGSTSAITGSLSFTLPVTHAQTSLNDVFEGIIYDIGVAAYRSYCEVDGSTAYGRVSSASGTYTTGVLFSSTVPMTWGNGDILIFKGSYEVA